MRSRLLINLVCLVFLSGFFANAHAQSTGDVIVDIVVEGNARVESEAIITMLKSAKGDPLQADKTAEDIRILYKLGYFSDIRIFREDFGGGVKLIVKVVEKPAISAIKYEGMNEITEDDVKEKIETKLYTIVNEASIQRDLGVIEKQYLEKGFYLARASYKLVTKGDEVELIFMVDEGKVVRVGDVFVLGNEYYSDGDIINKLFSRPASRRSEFSNPPALYNDDFLKRDSQFIDFYYKDQGFMEVKSNKPITLLDQDREFVRITFEVEEGLQYYVNKLDVTGDLLYPKQELLDAMQLKPKGLFRYSQFQKDIEMLVDKYGDLGYAFVDVNPIVKYNRDTNPPTADITYDITKGDKVYFGTFTVVGNSKTRDNVIRREFEVSDSELYSGTRLNESKRNVERLGFFEEVQAIRNRDEEDPSLLNYNFKVKEKPTGQLQAAIGFQPGQARTENQWFGQGSYREENQSGYGYQTNLSGKWNGGKNYELSTGFTNPRVNDSQWSLGVSAFWKNTVRLLTDDIEIQEKRVGGNLTVGRRIFELVRASITYQATKISTSSESFVIEKFREDGFKSSAIFSLSRNSTDNYLDPSEGSVVRLSQNMTGGPMGGDFQYMESSAEAAYFFPINFTETYRTYFHLKGVFGYLYPFGGKQVPLFERYRLGGYNDMRGYDFNEISPQYYYMPNPDGASDRFYKGGDKQLYFQLEYFIPLIPEANIKALVFSDAGRVYDDHEQVELKEFKYDYGFGFRWLTPVAPFRFEWAYPVEDGKTGDMKFIFYLGY